MAIVQQSGSSTSVGWIILDPNEILSVDDDMWWSIA